MKKKLAIVMFGLKTGGAELQFLELANWLNSKYELKVYAFAKRGHLDKEFGKRNITLETFDYNSKVELIKAMYDFYKAIKNYQPSTIISTSFIGNSMTLVVKKLLNIKQVISFQTIAKCMTRFKKIDRFVLNRFDYIIAGANQIEHYLKDHKITNTKIKVIHNWVDFDSKVPNLTKQETFEKFGMLQQYFNIGCIARLHEQKGQKYLLEAMKMISDDNFRLYIVGDGPEKESLLTLKNELNLHDRVVFLGEHRDKDYLNLLNSFDAIVMPSLYEGLPRTLLDAMYFKQAIIASAVDGNKEALKDNVSGLLIKPKSAIEIVNSLKTLKDNAELRKTLGENAYIKVINSFDMKKQFIRIEEILI
jgi:glycosyltransferase involved in cell wall biosynthesis